MHIVRTIAVFLFASALGAQTFRGSITGVVTDSSGAAMTDRSERCRSARGRYFIPMFAAANAHSSARSAISLSVGR